MRKFTLLGTVIAVFVIAAPAFSQSGISLNTSKRGELKYEGFEIEVKSTFEIEAVGYTRRGNRDFSIYAWIIDADDREPVWSFEDSRTRRVKGNRRLRKVDDEITLPAGRYELYLYAARSRNSGSFSGDFFDMLGDIFSDDDNDEYRDALDECYVNISTKSSITIFEPPGSGDNALIKFIELGDSERIRQGFELSRDAELRIYSVFEFPRGSRAPADMGWIKNAESGEKVWVMRRRGSHWAGGAEKNRFIDEVINLPAGKYGLHYVTDNSHSLENFNANPPYDPLNWGITVYPASDKDKKSFSLIEIAPRQTPLLSINKVRNDEYFEIPFRLKKDGDLFIHAIGEYSSGGREFVDYGWIQELSSGDIVWEMTSRNTDYAGGGSKNLSFEGTVSLSAGDYVACYITDGSHAYRSWNTSKPYEPKLYGLTIYPTSSIGSKQFSKLETREQTRKKGVLVDLTRIGDNAYEAEFFSLPQDTRIHIYAIGEGSRREMYDYGWIINSKTRRAVWEMTWRNSSHAGGAKKNRIFDDNITLDKGEYEVIYVTDGSHSFRGWNDRRPRNPFNWGIVVRVEE